VHISFSYSDGFGREIQQKIQAEPGPLVAGGPPVRPRWVGSGWTIFNNKGKPVRQYEPFFSQLAEQRHRFEFGVQVGVSSILFYDPVERVVATLHPNHTYEKVVFDPWRQTTWDVNDTVTLDPRTDADVQGFFLYPDGTPRLPADAYLPSWHALRTDPAYAAEANQRWLSPQVRNAEQHAAEKAAAHARTPTTAYFDTLGRPFLTLAHNGFEPDGTTPIQFPTRVHLDIEGNQRAVRDAIVQNGDSQGRVVMQYDYDLLGTRIHQASMDAGERWMRSTMWPASPSAPGTAAALSRPSSPAVGRTIVASSKRICGTNATCPSRVPASSASGILSCPKILGSSTTTPLPMLC
jgi:hypothetical protein